ncbi:MAG: DUF1972 domain-containing protein [Lactobacillales bacterium]|jgi:rhamnosyltransferase|nr:DUF1972 domain-containing protein [Lactobacillales bacterium]
MTIKQHIFIIGSRGLPARYGGFETFVEQLITNQKSKEIKYHVACQTSNSEYGKLGKRFDYLTADCFNVEVPEIGSARAIIYDIKAIHAALKIIKEEQIAHPIFYLLGNTIGGVIGHFYKLIHRAGGVMYVNPDGLEWRRTKWAKPIRQYFKYAERKMTQYADLVICDSPGIESYLAREYQRYQPQMTYIAYGTDTTPTTLKKNDTVVRDWFEKFNVKEQEYYLIVGRLVPENNYETMLREFMHASTKRKLVLITNTTEGSFFDELKNKLSFENDPRIHFVGSVYDQNLLKYIRENAIAYLHGHEVGGTNPSLLEALMSSKLNLLFDVEFNRRVAEDSALYWTKAEGNLRQLIERVEKIDPLEYQVFQKISQQRVYDYFTWDHIVNEYETLFLTGKID